MTQHLYRWFDKDDALLYIGISVNAYSRARQHQSGRWMTDEAVKMTVEHFNTRKQVLDAEKKAIRAEHPRYNIAHQPHGYQSPSAPPVTERLATENQISFIRKLQEEKSFPVSDEETLKSFTFGMAGYWISRLKKGLNPDRDQELQEIAEERQRLSLQDMLKDFK